MQLAPKKVETKVFLLVLIICVSMALLAARLIVMLQENALLHQTRTGLSTTVEFQATLASGQLASLERLAEAARSQIEAALVEESAALQDSLALGDSGVSVIRRASEELSADALTVSSRGRPAMKNIAPILESAFDSFWISIPGEVALVCPPEMDGPSIDLAQFEAANRIETPAQVANGPGEAIWLEPRVDTRTNSLTTTLQFPLRKDGEIVGIMGSRHTLGSLLDDLALVADTEGAARTYIFDSEGEVVFVPESSDSDTGAGVSEDPSVYQELQERLTTYFDSEPTETRSLNVGFKSAGTSYYAYARPLGVLDWHVAVVTNDESMRSQLNSLRWKMLIAALVLAVFLVFLLRACFHQLFVNRVVGLEQATRAFTDRGLVDFPEPGNDEIGSLVHAFEEMVKSIACREAELTVRNQQLKNEVSGRLSAVESLRESERKFRTLFDKSSDAILVFDEDRFVDCNEASVQLLEYSSKNQLLQMKPGDMAPERQPDGSLSSESFKTKLQVATTEGKHQYEWVCQTRNGREFWAELLVTRIPYGGHEALYMVLRDITRRKNEEEERVRLTTAIEQAAETIVIADDQGVILYVNPSFERQTGFTRVEALGHPISLFKSEDNDAKVIDEMWDMINSGEVWKGRIMNQRKDETQYQAETTISPVRDGNGAIHNYVIVSYDVTKEATLEAQLIQAQKMEAIGELASGIAHEINTPTQYIGDNIRFFQESFNDILSLLEKYKELVEAARQGQEVATAVEQVSTLAEEIDLDYLAEEVPVAIEQSLEGNSRVAEIVRAMKEFAHPGLEEKTAIDINHAITNTLAVARNEWKYVADIVTEFEPDLPEVPCLPGAFNQVLLNIIVNASHAIGDVVADGDGSKGTITITTGYDDGWAEIRIKDSGTGIPEDVRKKIFDPFFTTKGVGKGTGQGLALAHSVVVEKHHGTIDVESEPDSGTTFIIRIPLVENIPLEGEMEMAGAIAGE